MKTSKQSSVSLCWAGKRSDRLGFPCTMEDTGSRVSAVDMGEEAAIISGGKPSY